MQSVDKDDKKASPAASDTGVILVDHGSTFDGANRMLLEVVQGFREATGTAIVEPAHMELAEPTIAQAFARCVEQGAKRVVVHPYFLSPGRHSTSDIPRLATEAAKNHPGVELAITEPLGVDTRISEVILLRIQEALTPKEMPN